MAESARTTPFWMLPHRAQLQLLIVSMLGSGLVLLAAGALFGLLVVGAREALQMFAEFHHVEAAGRSLQLIAICLTTPLGLGIFQLAFVGYLYWFCHTPLAGVRPRFFRMESGSPNRAHLPLGSRIALRAAAVATLSFFFAPVQSAFGAFALAVGIGTWLLFASAADEEILYRVPLPQHSPEALVEQHGEAAPL